MARIIISTSNTVIKVWCIFSEENLTIKKENWSKLSQGVFELSRKMLYTIMTFQPQSRCWSLSVELMSCGWKISKGSSHSNIFLSSLPYHSLSKHPIKDIYSCGCSKNGNINGQQLVICICSVLSRKSCRNLKLHCSHIYKSSVLYLTSS